LGANEKEFPTCGYVQQNAQGSLLSLGSAEQQRLVQRLSEGEYNTDEIRNKIKKKVDDEEKELKAHVSVLGQIFGDIRDRESYIQTLEDDSVEPERPFPDESECKKVEQEEKDLKAEISVLNKELQSINKSMTDPIYEKIKNFESTKRGLVVLEERSNKELTELVNKLNELSTPWEEMPYNDLQKEYERIIDKKQIVESRQKIFALAESVYESYPEAKGSNLSKFLGDRLVRIGFEESQNEDALREAKIKKTEFDRMKKPQQCPDCKTPLAVIGGDIKKAEAVPENLEEIKDILFATINRIEGTLVCIDKEGDEVKYMMDQARVLKEELKKPDLLLDKKTIEDLDAYKEELGAYEAKQRDLAGEHNMTNKRINALRAEVEDYKRQLGATEKEIADAEAKGLISYDELKKDSARLSKEISKETSELGLLEKPLRQIAAYREKKAIYDTEQKYLAEMKEINKKAKDTYDEKKQLVKKHQDRYAAAIRLKELSDVASVSAMEMIISEINANAASHIDRLFEDDGTTIRLRNFAVTGKGEERAKFGIEILHKGKKVKKLGGYFSGGEGSRSCLAFQLGLSDMYNMPILMVDEGFAGLHEAGKESCLEVLKDVANDGKLIIVIEHGAPESFFDEVIEI
jgi:DNA repair exonuclease SbcCD ATPase subunit